MSKKPKVLSDGNQQWSFDFKDWPDAFEMFYRWKAKDPAFCLVLSTNSYTSGYWVERNASSDKEARVYRSVKAVQGLEARLKAAQREAKKRLGFEPASLGRVIV